MASTDFELPTEPGFLFVAFDKGGTNRFISLSAGYETYYWNISKNRVWTGEKVLSEFTDHRITGMRA